jgi:putative endonuclease
MYVLRSIGTGAHYIGMTSDIHRRLQEHNSKSGRWTSSRKPWELAGVEEFADRKSALARERYLKSKAGIAERRELFDRFDQGTIERKPL